MRAWTLRIFRPRSCGQNAPATRVSEAIDPGWMPRTPAMLKHRLRGQPSAPDRRCTAAEEEIHGEGSDGGLCGCKFDRAVDARRATARDRTLAAPSGRGNPYCPGRAEAAAKTGSVASDRKGVRRAGLVFEPSVQYR